jgi:CheY-like chemotaxis protein
MTPRQADVAFVLESVAGVRAVYALDSTRQGGAHFEFAIELDQGERCAAEAHYALLRVMTHEDCARVFFFRTQAPAVIAEAARPLVLRDGDREAAGRRVPLVAREAPPVGPAPRSSTAVLIVADDAQVEQVVREALDPTDHCVVARLAAEAVMLASERSFDLIFCEAGRAFGLDGLLAKLPIDIASRVVVIVDPSECADARWRLQGTERILTKPLKTWLVRERITRAGAVNLLWTHDLDRVVSDAAPVRRLTTPPASAPFSVLLADVDEDLHEDLRGIFRAEARHIMRRDPDEAAEVALSTSFHVLICSANAALHQRSFLDAIAREDPAGVDRVLVVAPARDVPYVKHKLAAKRRNNRVLALPVNVTTLRHEIFRDHPSLAERLAVADVANLDPAPVPLMRFRRFAVLVVDDDQTTQILFAAAAPHDGVDVTLATTPMKAFEHVTSRPVDLLIVSAAMRSDGGEPFYRVLWRMKPELKSRCVLVVAPDLVPPSAPPSTLPRVVERPLTRDAIARVAAAFADR